MEASTPIPPDEGPDGSREPSSFFAHYIRGLQLMEEGDLSGAVAELELATARDVSSQRAHEALEECRRLLLEEAPEEPQSEAEPELKPELTPAPQEEEEAPPEPLSEVAREPAERTGQEPQEADAPEPREDARQEAVPEPLSDAGRAPVSEATREEEEPPPPEERGMGAPSPAVLSNSPGSSARRGEPTPGEGSPPSSDATDRPRAGLDDILTDLKEHLARETLDPDELHIERAERLIDEGELDAAIRELQRSVRSTDPPLRAFELLGIAFCEKEQPRIAARVLAEAVERIPATDRDRLGVLYRLGVAYQRLDDRERALECYERVVGLDIAFRDVQERIAACSA